MDRIVQSWNEKRLYTPEEIETGDARTAPAARKPAAVPENAESDGDRLERLRRIAEHLNGGEG